jgi:hypothetical protein
VYFHFLYPLAELSERISACNIAGQGIMIGDGVTCTGDKNGSANKKGGPL